MADPPYDSRSPFGVALLVVSVIALLLIVFLTVRSGGLTGAVGGAEPAQVEGD